MIWVVVGGLIVIAVVLATWPMRLHNRLIAMRTVVAESWRNVDVELTRRWDLIPQLVSVARAYATHETQTLADLVARRAGHEVAHGGGSEIDNREVGDETKLAGELSTALRSFRAVAEAYPQLQASNHYGEVIANLRDTEDRIAAARRLYNGNVSRYNAALKSFPAAAVARRSGLVAAEFFEVPDDKKGVPPIRFTE